MIHISDCTANNTNNINEPIVEKEFVSWLINNFSATKLPVQLGIGDDAGVLQLDGPVVVATDTIADSVHFDASKHDLRSIGHKAISVSLSDIAAMGAKPIAATFNIFCPRAFQLDDLKQLFEGLHETSTHYDVQIFGGDTNAWDGRLVAGTTVFGTRFESAQTEYWQMSGGRAGDSILVTGDLGGSILAKHMCFEPRVQIGRYLIENYRIQAATDITDSLAIDLAAVANCSNCGFRLNEQDIPVSSAAKELSHSDERSPVEHALYDGEDFELLLFADPGESTRLLSDPNLAGQISKIGELNSSNRFTISNNASNKTVDLEIRGYVH